jgi:hypothetical protein
MIDSNILVIILLFLNIIFFCIGYLLGKSNNKYIEYTDSPKKNILKDRNLVDKPNISIDDTKIVTKIDTGNLEKKYDTLGEIKSSQDNLLSSINKLKNMKG